MSIFLNRCSVAPVAQCGASQGLVILSVCHRSPERRNSLILGCFLDPERHIWVPGRLCCKSSSECLHRTVASKLLRSHLCYLHVPCRLYDRPCRAGVHHAVPVQLLQSDMCHFHMPCRLHSSSVAFTITINNGDPVQLLSSHVANPDRRLATDLS